MEHKTINKSFRIFIPIAFLLIGILSGCYYDNEEELYPGCNTNNVTFSGIVKPIIDTYCYTCHNNNNASGGISLEGYANVAAAAQIPVGSAGSLYGAVSWATGNSPMPQGQNKLDNCSIEKIKAWIDAGTPDN